MTNKQRQDIQPGKMIRVNIESIPQISDVLHTVSGKSVLVTPQGSGSRSLLPDTDDEQLLLLNLERLQEIVKLAPADFYIRCQAGLTLSDLYRELDAVSLHFPFLAPDMPGTVGGMVACGQLQKGEKSHNISRWVLSVNAILASGQEIRAGAVTFKSVAGYDLPKLFCGSFGTLGVITEVALRLYPKGADPFGKDLLPVPTRIPRLQSNFTQNDAANATERIARKIKRSLDPDGIFPVIEGWNKGPITA
jgi:glycolate oxidase FAD binding subunit